MADSQVSDALYDLGFYLAHDGIKARRLPNQGEIVEDAVVSFGYHMIVKEPLKALDKWMPEVSQPYGDEILKFLGELSLMYGWKWGMGKQTSLGSMVLKQLLVQGSQMIVKQI